MVITNENCDDKLFKNARLTFNKQVEYLREKPSSRLAPMFYLHAVRPLVEDTAPMLANLTKMQIRSLEVVQNNTLRLILGTNVD